MKKKYVIILSEGKEYLCCHEDGCYYDVSCPMRSFTEGEEDFEIMDSGQNRHGNTYPYHKRKLKLVPGFYPNGWLAEDRGSLYGTDRQLGGFSGFRDSRQGIR